MPTTYNDQFFTIDPFAPPPVGTQLNFVLFDLIDQNDDGDIDRFDGDSVNGSDITQSYPGDTVTVNVPGVGNVTYTGITFYLASGQQVFTPTDGQVLQNGTFVSSTFVNTQGPAIVPDDITPPCFTPGTLIATPSGERRVETIEAGDLITTRDAGPQPVIWVGRRTVPGTGDFAPIRIAKGTFGNRRDLSVSPQHRMLVSGWRAELHCGDTDVLVPARHLVDDLSVRRAPQDHVTYIHLMLEAHQVIFAEGAATESLDPQCALIEGDRGVAREIHALFPDLPGRRHGESAAITVRGFEARTLVR